MNLTESIQFYREKETGAVALIQNPPNHSADNLILYTATYHILAQSEPGFSARGVDFDAFVSRFEITPGCLARYPGELEPSSWDDHLGAAVASSIYDRKVAQEISTFGYQHGGRWGDNELGRIPVFLPTVHAAAGIPLGIYEQILAAGAFIANCFEAKSETSGKCLLFLASQVLDGKGFLVSSAISIWRTVMKKRYPGGIAEVYGIYFGLHPFSLTAPLNFNRIGF